MRFQQNNPLHDYRDNLILSAALEIDYLQHLSLASVRLACALGPFFEHDAFLELLNDFAYKAIDRLVPEMIAESVRQELVTEPINMSELIVVLAKPIGAGLQILNREQA
jgi:hypothetical protein